MVAGASTEEEEFEDALSSLVCDFLCEKKMEKKIWKKLWEIFAILHLSAPLRVPYLYYIYVYGNCGIVYMIIYYCYLLNQGVLAVHVRLLESLAPIKLPFDTSLTASSNVRELVSSL